MFSMLSRKKAHPDPALDCQFSCTNGKSGRFEYPGSERSNWY